MKQDQIKQALLMGQTVFNEVKVKILSSENGGYYAYIASPMRNKVIETPRTVHSEGLPTFCERLAEVLLPYL